MVARGKTRGGPKYLHNPFIRHSLSDSNVLSLMCAANLYLMLSSTSIMKVGARRREILSDQPTGRAAEAASRRRARRGGGRVVEEGPTEPPAPTKGWGPEEEEAEEEK